MGREDNKDTIRSWTLGFPEGYIERKLEQASRIAGEIGPDGIVAGYDYSGPIADPKNADMVPYPNASNALSLVESQKAFISGWDVATLEKVKKTYFPGLDIDLVCQLGDAVQHNNRIYVTAPMKTQKLLKMEEDLFSKVADEELKLAIQGNLPVEPEECTRVHCYYLEGDGSDRGNLEANLHVKNKKYEIPDLRQHLKQAGIDHEFMGEGVVVDIGDQEAIRAIDKFFREKYTLNSFRLCSRGDTKIEIKKDPRDRDLTLDQIEEIFREVCGKEWRVEPNDDYCCDLVYTGDGKSVKKQDGVERYLEMVAPGKKVLLCIVGDKPGDMLEMENALNFPQAETLAEDYCIKNGLPHIPVINAIDYSLVVSRLEKQIIK